MSDQRPTINLRTGNPIDTSKLAEIAPGVFTGDIPVSEMPRYGVTKFVKVGDGIYRSILVTFQDYVKLNQKTLDQLGIKISTRVLRSLVYAGFVKGSKVSPFQTEFCVESLYRHRRKTLERGFWNERRLTDYSLGWDAVLNGTVQGEEE